MLGLASAQGRFVPLRPIFVMRAPVIVNARAGVRARGDLHLLPARWPAAATVRRSARHGTCDVTLVVLDPRAPVTQCTAKVPNLALDLVVGAPWAPIPWRRPTVFSTKREIAIVLLRTCCCRCCSSPFLARGCRMAGFSEGCFILTKAFSAFVSDDILCQNGD